MVKNATLLPIGIYDSLPPESAFEARVVARLLKTFAANGYEAVSPPLIEFEETLEKGVGKSVAKSMFRVMDPLSHRMMGVRADITPQIVRIAETRLKSAPRPLRLAYAGQVLRVQGEGLEARRQLMQAGIELLGSEAAAADVEVVRVAACALAGAKVEGLSADFSLPLLLPMLLEEYQVPVESYAAIKKAVAQKNGETVRAKAGKAGNLLEALMQIAGPADKVLKELKKLSLPVPVREQLARLEELIEALSERMPEVALTIDILEQRGFDYHAGIAFALFSSSGGGVELARGGRYYTGLKAKKKGGLGDAVGCTIAVDALLSAIPRFKIKPRVLLPFDIKEEVRRQLIKEKYQTIQALEKITLKEEAKRLKCQYYWQDGLKKL